MSCSNKACNVKGDNERVISCWLCDNLSHTKCAGISGRVVSDYLVEEKGIRWCCTACRKIDITFFKFFQSMHGEFKEMEKDFSSLMQRFLKFSKLFSDFPELEKVANSLPQSSPKRKKATKKIAPPSGTFCSPNSNDVSSQKSDSVAGNTRSGTAVTEPAESNPITVPLPSLTSVNSQKSASVSGNTRSGSAVNAQIENNPCIVSQTSESQTRTLTVIPARKTVFISRFAPDTSVDDIKFYISSRVDIIGSISVFKINSSSQNRISSFKILVSEEFFKKLIVSNFWPPGALVKEFVHRENPRRHNLATVQKESDTSPKN